jgi:hypothetical protein
MAETQTPEERIARKVYQACEAAGTPVVTIYDGGDYVDVTTEDEAVEAGFAVDIFRMVTTTNAAVLIVNGNEWDALSDYNVSLDEPMETVMEWIRQNEE